MFTKPIDEMREQISYSGQDVFWVKRVISPQVLAFGDMPQILEHEWHALDHMAAQNIFNLINDGELYCLRVKRFTRNFDYIKEAEGADSRSFSYMSLPEISMGYRGSLSKVRVEPVFYSAPEWTSLVSSLPTWADIRHGIRWRLKTDFKPNKLLKWAFKNILARFLYFPDVNPTHWGVDDF